MMKTNFIHDCDMCVLLGTITDVGGPSDLYACATADRPGAVSLLARYSSEGGDYTSSQIAYSFDGPADPCYMGEKVQDRFSHTRKDGSIESLYVTLLPGARAALAAARVMFIDRMIKERQWDSYGIGTWVSPNTQACRDAVWRSRIKQDQLEKRIKGDAPPIRTREFVGSDFDGDDLATTWVYNCGWYIQGSHPYRESFMGCDIISRPVGVAAFFKEYGVLPGRPA